MVTPWLLMTEALQRLFIEAHKDELNNLVESAKVQSTEASYRIEGILTTDDRLKNLVQEKITPRNRDESEIAGYREVLNIIHENLKNHIGTIYMEERY